MAALSAVVAVAACSAREQLSASEPEGAHAGEARLDLAGPTPGLLPLVWKKQHKLLASDETTNDRFGLAVAMAGDTAVIGTGTGAAYIFERSLATWTEQKLLSPGPAKSSTFARAVAIAGDTAIIGAPSEDTGVKGAGAAYVFIRSGATFSLQQKLTASDGATNDSFGTAVAIAGDTVIIGASGADASGTDRGAAYVFVRSGANWTERQKLPPDVGAPELYFGSKIAMTQGAAVISAPGSSQPGAAYVFVRSGANWTEQQRLTASDAQPYTGNDFGRSVAVEGDTVVVGAVGESVSGGPGAAYIFARSGTIWTEQQKLTDAVAPHGYYGASVAAVAPDTVFVGAPFINDDISAWGAAHVYARTGTAWILEQSLVPGDIMSNAHVRFGSSIAVSGHHMVVGTDNDDAMGQGSGSAYILVGGLNPADSCADHADGVPCDDGNGCSLEDTCQDGACVGANLLVCPDPPPPASCLVGQCAWETGQCGYIPKHDGDPCPGGFCSGGECVVVPTSSSSAGGSGGAGGAGGATTTSTSTGSATTSSTSAGAGGATTTTSSTGGAGGAASTSSSSSATAGGAAASTSASATSGAGGAGGGAGETPEIEFGGCGCTVGAENERGARWLLVGGLTLAGLRRRSRRGAPAPPPGHGAAKEKDALV